MLTHILQNLISQEPLERRPCHPEQVLGLAGAGLGAREGRSK